ncbi:MAG: N-terminal domain [Candidatus Woesearchaeota archaeon]|nr:N-terminal domain [Candidatus Woesearchaeota archaeon]
MSIKNDKDMTNEIKEKKDLTKTDSLEVFDKISELIEQARKKVAATINEEMVILYWNIGRIIK